MDWAKVQDLAMEYEPVMQRKWPSYLEEMKGQPLMLLECSHLC